MQQHSFKIVLALAAVFTLNSCERKAVFLQRDTEISHNGNSIEITKFMPPVDEAFLKNVSSKQGLRNVISEYETKTFSTSGKWHQGLDIPCPDKTPVRAAKGGKIVEVWPSYYNGGAKYKGHSVYGGLVIILHDDSTLSLYAHLSYTNVQEGQHVNAGDEIGWSGGAKGRRGSGVSTGPHLHFSVYIDMNNIIDFNA